jgi:heme exporter protein A
LSPAPTALAGFGGLAGEGLALARGGRRLFRNLSFGLEPCDLLLLLGPNGSGKSSLLRALLGLAPLAAGRLTLGHPARLARGREVCALALYQGHAGGAKAELTALENLSLAAGLDGTLEHLPAGAPDALAGALAEVGLARHRDIETRRLSQGQKQRLQLARFALALQAPVRPLWLMDEPSAALDAEGTALLQRMLDAHLARGGGAIVATHLPVVAGSGRVRELRLDTFAPLPAGAPGAPADAAAGAAPAP